MPNEANQNTSVRYYALGPHCGALGITTDNAKYLRLTRNHPGAVGKGFKSWDEAARWLESLGIFYEDGTWSKKKPLSGAAEKKPPEVPARKSTGLPDKDLFGRDELIHLVLILPKTLHIWTDASFSPGTGDKGYGIVLADKKKRRLAYLAVKCRENTASSALLEIAAVVKALDFVLKDHRPHHLIIHTDFLATVRLFQEKDFLKAIASYPEDFQELARRVAYWKYQPNVTLEIKKVKAHAGKCGNEEADALAKLGALGKN